MELISDWCAGLIENDGVYRIEPLSDNSIYIDSTTKNNNKVRHLAVNAWFDPEPGIGEWRAARRPIPKVPERSARCGAGAVVSRRP